MTKLCAALCGREISRGAKGHCLICFTRIKREAAVRICAADGCRKEVSRASRTGKCRSCAAKDRLGLYGNGPAEKAPCENGCGRSYSVSKYRKTKLCRRCAAQATARSPAKRALCSELMKSKMSDPEYRAQWAERVRAGIHRSMLDPAKLERRRENGRRLAASGKHGGSGAWDPSVRARQVASRQETRMAWCPPSYRPLYKSLRSLSNMLAADAKAMVLEQIETDRRRLARGELLDQPTFMAVRSASAWIKEREAA